MLSYSVTLPVLAELWATDNNWLALVGNTERSYGADTQYKWYITGNGLSEQNENRVQAIRTKILECISGFRKTCYPFHLHYHLSVKTITTIYYFNLDLFNNG